MNYSKMFSLQAVIFVHKKEDDAMKLPNGYGSVIKLGGKRRKPYAVRITTEYSINSKGRYVQKYKYLAYFEKSKDAYDFLSKYNAGLVTYSNTIKSDILFSQIFNEWITEHEKYKNVSPKTHESYMCAYRQLSELHNKKFASLRIEDLQAQIDKLAGMSQSTIRKPMILLSFLYKHALKYEYVDKDYSKYIIAVSHKEAKQLKRALSPDDVEILWNLNTEISKQVLIYIYTGWRATELLEMETQNINLSERTMLGGKKTASGKNRIVPIHNRILPLVKQFYNPNNKYLFMENGQPITYVHYKDYHFRPLMESLGWTHTMHDLRHTCASLMKEAGVDDFYRKLILGHHINDLTDRVYTHVEIQRLLLEINKIK